MDQIPRDFEGCPIHAIDFLAKMLLRLQHLKPNRLKPCDKGLDLKSEVLAHPTQLSAACCGKLFDRQVWNPLNGAKMVKIEYGWERDIKIRTGARSRDRANGCYPRKR
jgi:hypothetical protein